MKFNKPLFAILASVIFSSMLLSCASSHKKVSDQSGFDQAQPAENSEIKTKFVNPASILPPGPVTPNPYLQSKSTVNAATETSFRNAVTAMQQKNWTQAETLLQALAASNPNFSGVYVNLGIVYRNKGDIGKAADSFAQAIKINPKNLDAYNQLAVIKREAGQFVDAEKLYKKALEIWPFHADSHKNIAILYELYMGKPEQALPHYLAYQQLLPAPDKQVDSWIADLQRRLSGGKKAAEPEKNDPAAEVK